MEKIIIEKMNLSHYNIIKDILDSEFDDFWNKEILKEELENVNSRYIVAICENEIVGFAGIKYNYETVEVMNIVTKKTKRRKGIAEQLFKGLFELSKEFNVEKIELEVNEKNEAAINLYNKIGFKEVGRRKKYYDGINDGILMDYIL